jgi:hypothetical protein
MLLVVTITTVNFLAQRFVEVSMGFAEVSLVFDKVGCLWPREKLVLIALADHADAHGQVWPSIRELRADATFMSVTTDSDAPIGYPPRHWAYFWSQP